MGLGKRANGVHKNAIPAFKMLELLHLVVDYFILSRMLSIQIRTCQGGQFRKPRFLDSSELASLLTSH